MRTPSGILHVVDFKTEQIVSTIQSKDYWDDKRHWEIKNNVDTLEFKVFDNTDNAATLMQQNLVLKEVRDGRIVPYVITEIEKNSDDRSVTAYASGEWILLAKAGIITPQRIEGKTVNEFIDMALIGTKWKRGRTEYSGFHTMTIDEFIDPLKFLKDIASLFDLEIVYRAEVVGSQVVGRYVDMIKKRGRETGKEITLGKDLVGIRRIENSQNICTALVGFVKGEGDNIITIEKINNGLPYITDNDAFQRWNERGQHKFGFYTPETEDQNMTPQRLMTLMKTELKKRVNTSYSYDVQAQSIGRVFGLAHEMINEGDTIYIKDTGFTPKLYLEARVIAGDESFTDPTQDKYVFGDYREIVDPNEELRKLYNKVLASLGNKANKELLEQLEKLAEEAKKESGQAVKESQAAKELAEKVQENLKNNTVNIIEAANPPTDNLTISKTLWRDISNGKPGVLKVWNGKGWELLIPDVESVKKETLEQVNKDISATKQELNKKVEEAQKETSGQFKEVKENLQEVSLTIKNVQNSQGEINKTVSEMKQTNEGFTKSIELLTKKDGEITEKLNTVEETAEGTKKTIAKVQETTTELTKTTTEIKEQAGKISEKLESVEKKTNNLSVGTRNYILLSAVESELVNTDVTQTKGKTYAVSDLAKTDFRGKPIVLSFDAETNGLVHGTASNNSVGIELRVVYKDGKTNWFEACYKQIVPGGTNPYRRYHKVSPMIEDKEIAELTVTALFRSASGTVKFRNLQIEIGTIPSSHQPAPEDQVSTDEFTKKTTEIEKSVDGVKENITKVEQNQTGFDKRVTTVEKTADGIKQNVTSLQEIQTNQGKQLQEAKAGWETTAKALEGKVEIKQVEDYVGGIGNINVVRNSLFKTYLKYWELMGGSAFTAIDTNVKYNGCNSIRTIVTGSTGGSWYGAKSNYTDAVPGETFVASAYLLTDDPNSIDGKVHIAIEFFDSTRNRIKIIGTEVKLLKGQWTRVLVSSVAPENTRSITLRYQLEKNGRIWMAQPMLQKGTTPSSYLENPNDIVDKDKIMEDLADKVATEKYDKKVTELERSITANGEGVTILSGKQESFINETYNAYVKKTESKLQVLDEGIIAQILKDGIVTAINMSPGKITIDAKKLEINADTIVTWLTAKGINADLITIKNSKITINKDGVDVSMADFLYQDERGLRTTVLSKRNLVIDHDFSSTPKKVMVGNTSYSQFETGKFWRPNGNVVIENNTYNFDYERMVNATRVDMFNYPEITVKNGIHPGNVYTLSTHFRCATINGKRVTARPQLHVCYVTYRDNVHYDIWQESKLSFDSPSTFYGDIQRRAFTFTVPTNYKPGEHAIVIKVESADGDISKGTAVCASGVQLVTGKYPSMYEWQAQSAEIYSGMMPIDSLEFGNEHGFISVAQDRQTFDFGGKLDAKFYNNIRAVQGVNLGGNAFQGWGHIRFTDGNLGPGFYVNTANGWKFNALG
ncbi:phage tail spike protein [Bacillus cereus group sp. BfR-BA-01316]|uniref:phage tail spike protein n=1 Tax=Bacillus cereus group sp. BfR-BA-01316 TaxID=2920293 RepID=UPI001F56D938|nr:phage tail spike protein [Bacillus cereus group sp. BfR-BA-01316]